MDKSEEIIDLKTFLPDLQDSLHDLNRHLALVARHGSSGLLLDIVRVMGGITSEMVSQWNEIHGGGHGVLQ